MPANQPVLTTPAATSTNDQEPRSNRQA